MERLWFWLATVTCFLVFKPALSGHEAGLVAYSMSDVERARFEFLSGSELGDPRSQYMLGLIHDRGLSVRRDPVEAIKWYRLAANQGHALAQYMLGLIHNSGFDAVTRARSNAVRVGGAAATPSQRLGIAYVEALRWLTLAAEQGLPQAQYSLGLMYATGSGVPADFVAAHFWWTIAVGSGSDQASKKLSLLEGLMSEDSLQKARRLSRERGGLR